MFKIVQGNVGNLRSISLLNFKMGIEVEIIQDFGAMINKYSVNHSPFSFIVGYKDYDELINQHPYFSRSAKLFPFPNRLKCGRYQYAQREFTLPANFSWSEHAVHGLLYNQAFELIDTVAGETFAQIQLRFQTQSLHSGFPFSFQLDVVYRVDNTGQLSCHTQITNQGLHSFPYGDAWHPYFSLGTALSRCTLTMANALELEHYDDLPTGNTNPNHPLNQTISLQDAKLNHCYQFATENEQQIEFCRVDHIAKIIYQQDRHYPYVQLYTPQSEASVAIEPMTCPADAFNNKIGLLELEPNQSASFQWQCCAYYTTDH
jgi:aldose 1-epimerase